jgi:hypothetical protein
VGLHNKFWLQNNLNEIDTLCIMQQNDNGIKLFLIKK